MEDLNQPTTTTTTPLPEQLFPATNKTLLILNCILLSIGNCGGPLILRLYFIHHGHRIWLISNIQTIGFPFIFIILTILYFHRRHRRSTGIITTNHHHPATTTTTTFIYMRRRLFFASAFIGILTGVDNYLYTYGVAHLPISTYALINATRLVFMAVFAFILVKQKFTAYSVNAVVLLTVGAVVLAVQSGGDRPSGEKKVEYVMGFVMTVVAAALYGMVSPLVEMMYKKAKQVLTYTVVLEVQMMMCVFATVFCTVGMIFNNDFKVILRESENFELERMKYYLILSISVVLWQCFFLGAIGIIFYGSSLLLGVIVTIQIPVTEVLALIFYNEKFKMEKGVALVLSLWGFISYFYGEYKYMKQLKDDTQSAREVV